jgi:hypothetical protein
LQTLVCLHEFEADGDVVLLVEQELRREVLYLRVQQPEGIGI